MHDLTWSPLESLEVELSWRFTESNIDTIRESNRKKKPINTNVQTINRTCLRNHICLFPIWAPLQEFNFPDSFFNLCSNAAFEFQLYSPAEVLLPVEGSFPGKVSEHLTWWFFIPEDNSAFWNSGFGLLGGHCFTIIIPQWKSFNYDQENLANDWHKLFKRKS